MITKFEKYNESVKSLLVGPTKEEVWKNLGYVKIFNRTFDTSEEYFIYLISNMKIQEQTEYPYIEFYEVNGKLLFEKNLRTKNLWVDNNYIWKPFKIIFGLSEVGIRSFLKKMIKEHLKWDEFNIRYTD